MYLEKKNYLLFSMLASYLIAIFNVYNSYSCNNSVSNIIGNEKCNNIIFISMLIMGVFTILYELIRKDHISLNCIILLLIGIYGIIYFNEKLHIHYIFAGLIFISILYFMIHHFYITRSKILYLLLCLQILISCITIINMYNNNTILFQEIFLIFNFAIFYLYLHYNSNI